MKKVCCVIVLFMMFSSCKKVFIKKDPSAEATSVFDYIWKEIDEKYVFFNYKHIDWQAVKEKYRPRIYDGMGDEALFSNLASMMNELKDGHSNVIAPFNTSYYSAAFYSPQVNFDFNLLRDGYLLRNEDAYRASGPFLSSYFDTLGVTVGIIRYASFGAEVTSADIDYLIDRLSFCDGIIIDIRNNGGGAVDNIYDIANRFADQRRLVYYQYHKSGPGHEDFIKGLDVYLDPQGARQFTKRTAVLTNRKCFSAASFFSLAMRSLPHVRLIGDTTAGGLGAPNGGELPNGWGYRVSVEKTITPAGENYESGVPVHFYVTLDPMLAEQGYDSIIERAIQYIKTGE